MLCQGPADPQLGRPPVASPLPEKESRQCLRCGTSTSAAQAAERAPPPGHKLHAYIAYLSRRQASLGAPRVFFGETDASAADDVDRASFMRLPCCARFEGTSCVLTFPQTAGYETQRQGLWQDHRGRSLPSLPSNTASKDHV